MSGVGRRDARCECAASGPALRQHADQRVSYSKTLLALSLRAIMLSPPARKTLPGGRFFLALSAGRFPLASELVPERPIGNAQELRRLGAVAAGLAEGELDERRLGFVDVECGEQYGAFGLRV